MTSFYTDEELSQLGLAGYGENVLISRKASIYSPDKIRLGNNVRIDDFCVLSGRITLGNYVHIAVCTTLFGGEAGIEFDDYSTASSRCGIFAHSDEMSGLMMTNPTIPAEYETLIDLPVYVGKHSVIGTGSTVLPGVRIEEGSVLGAMTLAKTSTEPWGIYFGIPARRYKERSRRLLDVCKRFEESK